MILQQTINIIILVISYFLLESCSSVLDKKDNNLASNHEQLNIGKNLNTELKDDSIQTIYNPNEADFISKILTEGTFHEDEVWDNAKSEIWFGIFNNNSDVYLAETKLLIQKAYDPIMDEDSLIDKSGWKVKTTNLDSSILLVSGLNFIKNHKIKQHKFLKKEIYPGDKLIFNFLNIEYEIYATGIKKPVNNDHTFFEVSNYKLYLKAKINGKFKTDLLLAISDFDDEMIDIKFAGDIDDDGILDLIIDTSNDYNTIIPTLFLSKPADNNHILKVVGQHVSTGC